MYCDLLITFIVLGSSGKHLFQMIELNKLLFFLCSFMMFYLLIWKLFVRFICFQMSCKLLLPITSSYCSLYTTWKILELMKEKSAVTDWLSSVRSLLPVTTQVPAHIFLLLAYLLIQEKGDSLRDVLQTTTEVAKADCSQVKT